MFDRVGGRRNQKMTYEQWFMLASSTQAHFVGLLQNASKRLYHVEGIIYSGILTTNRLSFNKA